MPDIQRRLAHTRSIQVDAYAREDGLWDLVARIRDVKQRELQLEWGVRPAGEPLHDMELTVTIDVRLTIVAVQARTLAAPYAGSCDSFPDVYQKLVGLNLLLGSAMPCASASAATGAAPTSPSLPACCRRRRSRPLPATS